MRYEGLFDAGRAVIREAMGEDLTPGVRLHDARSVYDELLTALEQVAYICERRDRPSSETYATLIEIANTAIANAHAAREQEI